MNANYKLIGKRYNKDIYFPLDLKEKKLWLTGMASSGKTTVMKTLSNYYQSNGIKYILMDFDSKFIIPIEYIDSTICLFKLSNSYIKIDNESIDETLNEITKNKDKYNNKFIFNYNSSILSTTLLLLNIFYVINSNNYSILLLDEISSDCLEFKNNLFYLLKDTNVQVIETMCVSQYYSNTSDKNIIFVNDCYTKNTKK